MSKRESIWSGAPYGRYQGERGNSSQWKSAFNEAMSQERAQEILGNDSPWKILGIAIGATLQEIKKAWRKCIMLYHPDRHPAEKQEWASEMFIKCKAAFVQLTGE